MNTEFDDIRPYFDSEISAAMQRICKDRAFPEVAHFIMPGSDENFLRSILLSCSSVDDFQKNVMVRVVDKVIAETIDKFTFDGLENVDCSKRYLFITNHRDIVLDPALLQYILYKNNIPTTEIAVGDNLITTSFIEDIVRSNKMIKVVRNSNPREFLVHSAKLSKFVRQSVSEGRSSIWIAQRNGRTKDGIDVTEQGLLKMFSMSSKADFFESFAPLNIFPIALSYEFEPCDIMKAVELYISRNQKYIKAPDEDLNSILQGIMQYKGSVHYQFCKPISREEVEEISLHNSSDKNERYKMLANLITKRINAAYKLFPNNYIAADILNGNNLYAENYTAAEREKFEDYLQFKLADVEEGREEVRRIFLGIYANPVETKKIATNL